MASSILMLITAALLMKLVHAQETHYVSLVNNCGQGYPVLGGLYGEFYNASETSLFKGPAWGLIAYLQYTDNNGMHLAAFYARPMVLSLLDRKQRISVDITLVPPHEFSVTTGFGYYGGCDGSGLDCTSADCIEAKHDSSQGDRQIACTAPNVNLAITFCD
ncbi:uncharacterized protein B0H18DRAFT_1208712 [Fomitopsis serialis]|uniref:uncharacterized protein n=1 Tax=Fomitopsis serialis TaxID=139415 RepID=UPI0020079C14|nr:uncharacterized protein B0H18DRAFT_1208712 [Neoantrodia serialis]KAH9931892.1 hypothetical protein B0H18DRAFT_1208712 [Neoantrodia serialis]